MAGEISGIFDKTDREQPRGKIVRQDRIAAKPGQAWLVLKETGVRVEVQNYSTFGILGMLKGERKLPTTESVCATLFFMDFAVQEVKMALVREDSAADGFYYAFEVLTEPVDLNAIGGIQAAREIIAQQEAVFVDRQALDNSFKLTVIEIKDWLHNIACVTLEQEKAYLYGDPFSRARFESSFAQALSEYFQKEFPAKHLRLLHLLKEIPEEKVDAHLTFFREQLAPIIHQAPVSHRAYNKPRGYAGDFEMMNQIYRNNLEGQNLFARALHHYFVNEPAGQAVRNRKEYLIKKIRDTVARCSGQKCIRILSVASGPAREAQEVIKSLPAGCPHVELHLIDQDEESLKGAQFEIKRLGPVDKFSLKMLHTSIKQIIMQGIPEGNYDLVYSAGLFDYFSDPVAQSAAARLCDAVAPRGSAIIGNFSLHNPSLPLMKMAWDWHLIYRSDKDLMRLFHHLGNVTIEAEPLGINLFAVIEK